MTYPRSFLKIHRKRMADLRSRKKRDRLCRQCDAPAKVTENGRVMSACPEHLKSDAKRVLKRRKKMRRVR